jgi:hypothetical protein
VDVLSRETKNAAIEGVMQAYHRKRGMVGRRGDNKKARMQKRASLRCPIGVGRFQGRLVGAPAALRVFEVIEVAEHEEEEEGVQRGGSKEQVKATHEAKGGVYGAEEMGMFH